MQSIAPIRNTLSAYDWLLCVTQTLAYLIAALPLRIMFRVNRRFRGGISHTKRGMLLVANHQAHVDPFLILACLPPRAFLKLLPIYFPTTEAVFTDPKYNPKFFPLIWLLGCFSIGNDTATRTRSMLYIRALLEHRRTVVIFPEGKLNKDINLDDFQRGTDFFIERSQGALFVRISGVSEEVRQKGQTTCVVSFSDIVPPDRLSPAELDVKSIISSL